MDFEFTQEQQVLRHTIREFAEEKIAPHVQEWDERAEFPMETMKELGSMGILGVIFSEKYGGAGMSYVDYVIVVEELSRVEPSIGIAVAAHNSLCSNHINLFGTEEQKQKYLVPLASGEKIGAWALTEPGSGSDAGALRTTAVRKDGGWLLNGRKCFCTHATVGDIAVVMTRTEQEGDKHGITAFIVEKGTEGFSHGKKENKLGLRASDTGDLVFEDCFLPDENRLGEVNQGFRNALSVLDGGRISIAALSLGGAQGAFDAARKYALQREAFGKKIGKFQAIQWMLADMATRIEAASLLTYQAAFRKDEGLPVIKQSSMAKLYASEVSVWVSERAVQVFGGYGFIKEYPVEKFYRDTKLNTIGEGTSEIQRMVIARELLKEYE